MLEDELAEGWRGLLSALTQQIELLDHLTCFHTRTRRPCSTLSSISSTSPGAVKIRSPAVSCSHSEVKDLHSARLSWSAGPSPRPDTISP